MIAKFVNESIDDILKPKSNDDISNSLSNLTQGELNDKLEDTILYSKNFETDYNIIKLLIDKGAEVSLFLAIRCHVSVDILKLLINSKKYNNNDLIEGLMIASQKDFIEYVELFIQNGINVNSNNDIGTALMFAAANNHKKIVELLIKNGADVNLSSFDLNIKTKDNFSALKLATINGHNEVVELLKKYGAKE